VLRRVFGAHAETGTGAGKRRCAPKGVLNGSADSGASMERFARRVACHSRSVG